MWRMINTYGRDEVAPGEFVGHVVLNPDAFYGDCMAAQSDLFISAVNFTNVPAALLFASHRKSLCPPHPLLDGLVRKATSQMFTRSKLITRELLFFVLVGLQWFWIGKYSLREGWLRLRTLPVWIISVAGLGLAVVQYLLDWRDTDPTPTAVTLLGVVLGTWFLWAVAYLAKVIDWAGRAIMRRHAT